MGKLFVICGPSGAGLREIVGSVLESRSDIGSVVPVTAVLRSGGLERAEGIRGAAGSHRVCGQ